MVTLAVFSVMTIVFLATVYPVLLVTLLLFVLSVAGLAEITLLQCLLPAIFLFLGSLAILAICGLIDFVILVFGGYKNL